MKKIFVVCHLDQETMDDDEQEKQVGVYSTNERAEQAIERLRDKPGFRDFPERWFIHELTLDQDSFWMDGFVTVYPGDEPWKNSK